jgi:hypothetical protein
VRDEEIDNILRQAGEAPHDVDPRLLDRIGESIRPKMQPVRPLCSPLLLTCGLVAVCAGVAVAGASRLGFAGLFKLSTSQRALIFPLLAIFLGVAALECVAERIPGQRRFMAPGRLLAIGSVALIAAFAVMFQDYGTEHFVSQGMTCLIAGLAHAIPAALIMWLLLRRGFAVDPAAAGLASGMLAGLAGLLMLELHCVNFEAPHVMLWHSAVVWVAAGAGVLIMLLTRRKSGV